MSALENAFGQWILRYRWQILLITLVLVGLAAAGGRNLSFSSNYRIFFSDDNPQLLAFEALEQTYTKADNVLFVVTTRDGVFTPEALQAVMDLTEKAWQTPYSTRVDSVTNFQHTWSEGDDMVVENLVSDPEAMSADDLARVREIALNEPLLINRLVNPEAMVTGVNVTVQLPGKDETTEVPEVVSFARGLAAEMAEAWPELEIRLTGMVLMNNAFSENSKKDMQFLVPVSILVMLVTMGLLIKGFTGTVATIGVIGLSIFTAMGLGGHIGLMLSPPSSAAPIIILTVAIANSVHVLVTLLHEMRAGLNKREAIVESLRVNLQPVTLASATTAIGFLTMNFSEVPPFRDLGNFVTFGVLASWILSLSFLPALMSLLPVRVRERDPEDNSMMQTFGDFVVRRRTMLLFGTLGLIVLTVSFLPRNELNDVFVNYFDKSVAFRADTDYATEHLTGTYNMTYSLVAKETGGVSSPAFLQEVDAFAEWFRRQPGTSHVNTFTDIMKRLNRNMHGDDPGAYQLPRERELAAQYLLLYEMSLPYGLDLNDQINIDKTSTRVVVTMKTMSTKEILALEQEASGWIRTNAPNIARADASGPTLMFAHIGSRNIVSMLIGTSVALVLISLLLMAALRSVKIGLISMVPNLVPAAMGFGLWGLLVGEVGLALSVVSCMTLGIVVDDTVHFLSKYLRARREKGYDAPAAVRYAFTTVGKALLVTTIVLVAGFAVLSLSNFHLNSGMGQLTAIVIAFAIVADFLFLPPLLIKLEEKKNEQEYSEYEESAAFTPAYALAGDGAVSGGVADAATEGTGDSDGGGSAGQRLDGSVGEHTHDTEKRSW